MGYCSRSLAHHSRINRLSSNFFCYYSRNLASITLVSIIVFLTDLSIRVVNDVLNFLSIPAGGDPNNN